IYRSDTPVTSTVQATKIGRLFEPEFGPSHIVDEFNIAYGPALAPTGYLIPNGSGGTLRLTSGQGLFVATVRASGSHFYSVVPHGQTAIAASNRSSAVSEIFSLAQPPAYHLQATGTNTGQPVQFHAVWLDGDDNLSAGRPDFPIMAHAARAGIPRIIMTVLPIGGLPAGGPHPAMLLSHGADGSAIHWLPDGELFKNSGAEGFPGVLVGVEDKVFRIEQGRVQGGNTLWFGWVPSWDPFSQGTFPPDDAVVLNYTHRWLSWTLDSLLASPTLNLDSDRIGAAGYSRGSVGLLHFTRTNPERFSSVTLYCSPLEYFGDGPGHWWPQGHADQNLLTNQITRAGEPMRLKDAMRINPIPVSPRELPFTRLLIGQREEYFFFDTDHNYVPDLPTALRTADTNGIAPTLYWDLRKHGTDLWTYDSMVADLGTRGVAIPGTWTSADFWAQSIANQPRRDDAFYQARYRVRQSYPAFTHFQNYADHGSFGTTTYPNNQGTYFTQITEYSGTVTPQDGFPPRTGGDDRGTWGGYHEWEPSTIVDTATKWEATLWLVNAAVQTNLAAVETSPFAQLTSDVAIRKPQAFKPAAGSSVTWRVTNAATGTLLQSGTATVAADGLITIPGVTVLRDPNKVKLTLEGPPVAANLTASQSVALGQTANFSVTAEGTGPFTYQWHFNGVAIPGATSSLFTRTNIQPAHAGAYSVAIANALGSTTSALTVLGINSTAKVAGTAIEFAANIVHANGNIYDQVLLNGSAATITADPGQIVRASYIDLTDDIVQIEFSGAGSLTIALENLTGPALAVNYNQPTVQYVRGHATLTLSGANETTHVSVFTVGTVTAVNPTLFKPGVTYDGVADIAALHVFSPTNRLGSVRFSNTEFSSGTGPIGLNAPGIRIGGPVNIHNVTALNSATPLLLTGTIDTGQIGITGGDLFQPNGRAIGFGAAQKVAMLAVATSTSHNPPSSPAPSSPATATSSPAWSFKIHREGGNEPYLIGAGP
ncbi:MAG: hypothetical protein ABIZ49_07590, partial [Opitutaceae bacterium]